MNPSARADNLPDDLLLHLREQAGEFFSKRKLAMIFNTDISEIEKALLTIEEWGYRLNWRPPAEVAFAAAPDLLTATEIAYDLNSTLFGKNIISFGEVKSTNDIALQSAEKGAAEGTVITADSQSAGRGRLGRDWHSPAGKGIYLSIILRPGFPPGKAPGISLMTALALARALESLGLENLKVKWPNDLLVDGKKVAGILTELAAEREKISALIVGVGINVNHDLDDFPGEIAKLATSVRLAAGKSILRVKLLQEFLRQFETHYEDYQRNFLASMQNELRRYSSLIGREIALSTGNETIEGKAVDIDLDGRLVLFVSGKELKISSGEVTILKK